MSSNPEFLAPQAPVPKDEVESIEPQASSPPSGSERGIFCAVCENSPLLATYGIDEKGRVFVHVKVFKARQVKAELFIRGGEVTLKCVKCLRYNKIIVVEGRPQLSKTRRPILGGDPDESSSLLGNERHP